MKTRMEKYYETENIDTPLRAQKNVDLYENINNYEVNDYKLDSNATIIDNNAQNIDVEHIKKILDTRYNKEPKRKSIVLEPLEEEKENISLDETREYDINAILEKARSEKEVDYEKERLKKIRDTQYDILNSLVIDGEKIKEELASEETKEENISTEEKEESKKEDNELMDLINTITMREMDKEIKEKEIDPLDILSDLRGNDDTVVVGGMQEEESINETSPIMSLEEAKIAQDEIKEKEKEKKEQEEKLEKTASLTNTLTFTQSDFDDFNDLKKEVKSSRALIYVVIILVSLILIAGLVIFLNKFLNIGLF